MSEQILDRYLNCPRCGRLVQSMHVRSHIRAHTRVNLLHATRMEMNLKGVNFQPGQVWAMKHTAKRRAANRPVSAGKVSGGTER